MEMENEFNFSWVSPFLDGSNNRVLILLSDGFDDLKIMSFVKNLRENSISVIILGFSKRQVRSMNGIQVHPDLSLNNIGNIGGGSILIIPAGNQLNSHLLTDPRIHGLIKRIVQANGYVFTSHKVVSLINQDLLMQSDHLIAWS